MSAVLVVPPLAQPEIILRQQLAALSYHFPDVEIAGWYCPGDVTDYYANLLGGLHPVERAAQLSCRQVIEFEAMPGMDQSTIVECRHDAIIWSIAWDGQLQFRRQAHSRRNREEIFRRCRITTTTNFFGSTAIQNPGLTLRPFGSASYRLGMGPIDELGYRIDFSWRTLADRPASHKVVACFGGSAVWSYNCLHPQMFTSVAERELRRLAADRGLDWSFSVLNFGQLGAVLVEEMFAYLLFCQSLRPDVVIAHDGYNDLLFGQVGDSGLLDRYALVYPPHLEQWAQILHPRNRIPLTQPDLPYRSINHGVPIIQAYVERKRQFQNVATFMGARFIWGLQPMYASKPRQHPIERQFLRARNAAYLDASRRVPALYDLLLEKLYIPASIPFVNFHKLFSDYGEDDFLLTDHVHVSPQGDRIIGEKYARVVFDMLAP